MHSSDFTYEDKSTNNYVYEELPAEVKNCLWGFKTPYLILKATFIYV